MLYEHDAKLHGKVSAWVREWANKLTDALKKALADVAPNSATARALSQTSDTMTELQKIWDPALVGAVENKAKSPAVNSEAVQYEVRELVDGTLYTKVDAKEIAADGATESDSIGKRARMFMRKRYRGLVLPLGKTKATYIMCSFYLGDALFL